MNYSHYFRVTTLAFILTLVSACQQDAPALPPEIASVGHPVGSQSGKYMLHVVANKQSQPALLQFEIRTHSGETIFISDETFDDRHTTYYLWDEADRVWVYSGDVGTFFWQLGVDQKWSKYSYVDMDVSAPPYLKEQRPRWHQK